MASELRPFVGPVAFSEAQGSLFFGRLRDERNLLSMVIARPLVLLYAPSGAGKSSLVNAKLIPALRERGIQVLGPARVKGQASSRDGERNVYERNLISSIDRRSGDRPRPEDLPGFLAALPHAIDEAGEKTLRVVVIDQMEELFTFAPECWPQREKFIRQVAVALDQDPLLRILLAIKEDALAQLDTLAELLPERLRHRFRLDFLSPESALQAIEEPIKLAGRSIDDEALHYLRDEFLKVRVQSAGGGTSEVAGEHVEPVQLQVVCDAVWASLPAGVEEITLDHVKAVGDVDGALGRFYENVLKETAREHSMPVDRLRAWVDEYLLTQEGTRGLAYQGTTLTGRGGRGIANAVVADLEAKHLVRAETRPGGERWYELCHDRFIAPIQSSNQHWKQQRARRRDTLRIGAVFMAVLLLALGLVAYVGYRNEEYGRVEGQIDRLLELGERDPAGARRKAESVLSNLAGYLWQKRELPRLELQLKRAQGLIDEDFGQDPWVPYVMPEWVADPLLTVQFSSDSRLNVGRLQYQWARHVRELARLWGIAAPQYVKFEGVRDLPPDQVRVRTNDDVTRTFTVTSLPQGWWITGDPASNEQLRTWFEARRQDWVEISDDWWGVPAWTVPLLRAAGEAPSPREGTVVIAVLNRTLAEPELLLKETNTVLLLQRARFSRREVVDEALTARGSIKQISRDLQAIVRSGVPLIHLAHVLDALTQVPVGASTSEAARDVEAFYASTSGPARERLAGPAIRLPRLDAKAPLDPFAETLRWVPLPTERVRVGVGPGLVGYLIDQDGNPLEAVLERVEKLRGDTYRKLGVALEPVAWDKDERLRNSFAVQVLNQSSRASDAQPIDVDSADTAADKLLAVLDARLSAFRGRWLLPQDSREYVDHLAPAIRDWVLKQYSVADLTAVLRRFLDEHEGSLRDASWLLESLVFWAKAAEDPMDSASLAQALARTQQAHLHPPSMGTVEPAVELGIRALEQGKAGDAAGDFGEAIAKDRRQAIRSFLAAYARRSAVSPESRLQELETRCGVSGPGRMGPGDRVADETRFDVEDVLDHGADSLALQVRVSLQLCLVRSYMRSGLTRLATSTLEQLAAEDPSELSPDQLYATGYWLLEQDGFPTTRPANADRIDRLLAAAFRGWDTAGPAEVALRELNGRYQGRYSVPEWHLTMLANLAGQRADSVELPLEVGYQYAVQGRTVDDGAKALDWLERASGHLGLAEGNQQRAQLAAWIQLYRAYAHQMRADHGDAGTRSAEIRKAESELKSLIGQLRQDGRVKELRRLDHDAFVALIDTYRMARDFDAARKVLDEAQTLFPDDVDLTGERIARLVDDGYIAEALVRLQQSQARPNLSHNEKLNLQLQMAMYKLVSGSGDSEVSGRTFLWNYEHPYRDYVRLMLYWRLQLDGKPGARHYLEERWAQIRPESWKSRLEGGGADEQVWREKLIGYYLGKVDEADLMAPLLNRKTFDKSPYSRMGVHGLTFEGMTCEANFYSGLLNDVSGDVATRRGRLFERLQKCAEVCPPTTFEYQMARYLIARAEFTP